MVPRPGGAKKEPGAGDPAAAAAASQRAAPQKRSAPRNPRQRNRSPLPLRSPPAKEGEARRAAKRRPAAPPRARIAANDDAPSIGGLIFALQQKPSNRPFMLAAAGSGGWLAVGGLLAWAMLAPEIARSSFLEALASPIMIIVAATIFLPIALFWFLALLVWRAQELKLMSSAMTEVAVRLAEPDRGAEQSAASLGQAVRRQVSFMNEAISRALGRAGELEGLVHNEVASLEKSYGENEHKIRGLIQELAGERHALVSTTDKVSETLKAMGSEVPTLIDKLSQQQIKLAKIIEGAGQNLIALENQLSTASGSLETTLANRTQQLAGGARRLHGRPRRHPGQPRRGTRHPARGAHARAGRRLRRAPDALRRCHDALDDGHRQRGEREGPRADLRHGKPCPRALRHPGPAGATISTNR